MSAADRQSSEPATPVSTSADGVLQRHSHSCVDANMAERREQATIEKCQLEAPNSRCDSNKVAFLVRRVVKFLGLGFVVATFVLALIGGPTEIIDSNSAKANFVTALFLIAQVLIIFEDRVGLNKAAVVLLVSGTMWMLLAVGFHPHESAANEEALSIELNHGLQEVGSIILFLLPAMGVVESIDHFDGFAVVTHGISTLTQGRKQPVIPLMCLLTFFLSAIIDNLTATIVALKIIRRVMVNDRHLRHLIGGVVVISANAGGTWSPVGDVTTTMLWLQAKITPAETAKWLILPSLAAAIFPMLGIWFQAQTHLRKTDECLSPSARDVEAAAVEVSTNAAEVTKAKTFVLCLGVVCVLLVPVLKTVTGLPPYLGMLLALGILWTVTDTHWFHNLAKLPFVDQTVNRGGTSTHMSPFLATSPGSVVDALHKMDLTGLLFFSGVLLAVGALHTAGVLDHYAKCLVELCGGKSVAITSLLGVASAVVDNVPLVQAAINMFPTTPVDDSLWQLLALAAGTGGSILSVGSIAGVTLMTMEGVGYLWYCRKVSLWAAFGFGAGIGIYELQRFAFGYAL